MKTQLLLALSVFLANKLSANAFEVGTATDKNAGVFDMLMTSLKRDGRH